MPTFLIPSRTERILRATGYCLTACAGIWVLVVPPPIGSLLGQNLAAVWAVFTAMALPMAVAGYWGRYRWEYTLLPVVLVAMATTCAVAWINALGAEDGGSVTRSFLFTALLFSYANRLVTLHRLVGLLRGAAAWTKVHKTY